MSVTKDDDQHQTGSSQKSALEIARDYLARGWAVLPLPHRSKYTILKGWQNLRLAEGDLPAHFTSKDGPPMNVGVLLGEPSGGLVDVDLDTPEAVRVAPYYLNETLTFGRLGNPRSHWLYYVSSPPKRSIKHIDPRAKKERKTKEMVVELRSTGSQTVFPGSVHVCGESIVWENALDVTKTDVRDLSCRVGKIAAAALLLRYYPAEGARQDFCLALAGGLLSAGWTIDETTLFVRAIALEAGDEEVEKRCATVPSTADRLKRGEPVTSWSHLKELC